MKRTSALLIVGIMVLVLAGAYTGYQYFQKSALSQDLKRTDKELLDQQNEVLKYEANNIVEAINAKTVYETLKANTLEWSGVIKKIRETIPKDKGIPIVEVISYSGSSNQNISLNVKTDPDRDEPYFDTADFIKSFDHSESFDESFIPAISSGLNEEGREVLSFMLGAIYQEVDAFENLSEEGVDADKKPLMRK